MGQGKKLWILVLVVVVLAGGYFVVSHFAKDTEGETEEDAGIAIEAMQKDAIVGIDYLSGNEEIHLIKSGENWQLKGDKGYPVNQAYPATMAADAAELSAKRLVSEDEKDLEEYGLKNPSTAFSFTLSDGSKVTYFIGNYNSFGNSYYMNVAGTPQIWLISADFLEDFDFDLSTLAEVEEIRKPSTEEVTKLTLTLDGKTTSVFTVPEGLDTVYSKDFTWFLNETTPADAVNAKSWVGNAVNYTSVGCASYKATEAQMTDFGLTEPVATLEVAYTVTEEVETGELDEENLPVTESKLTDFTLQMIIGKQAPNGAYYAKLVDSDIIYLLDAAYLDDLRAFDVSTLRSGDVCAVRSGDIRSMDVTVKGKKSTITVDRQKKEDGSQAVTYTLGDKQLTATDFNDFYSSIQGMVSEGFADKAVDGDAAITVIYHTTVKNFENMTLQLIPYDSNFYVADLNGRREVLVNKRDVEKVISAFNGLQGV